MPKAREVEEPGCIYPRDRGGVKPPQPHEGTGFHGELGLFLQPTGGQHLPLDIAEGKAVEREGKP